MGVIYNPKIVTGGLVLCLDAGNRRSYAPSGGNWNDLSGNGNNGTLVNGPTFSGDNGGGIVFDGTNDYVNVQHKSSLSFTNKLTIQLWCSSTNTRTWNSPLMKTSNGSWADGFGFYQNSQFYFYVNSYSGSHIVSVNKTIFPFTHWAGVYDGLNLKIYENGILRQTGTSFTSNISNSSASLDIGRGGGQSYYWQGNIAQVLVYNRALTAIEILQNFNATRGRYGI